MTATAQQVIAGLYAAFLNRASDAIELNTCLAQIAGANDLSSFATLAMEFTKQPQFNHVYGFMSNQEFVEAIYKNALGNIDNVDSISYWVDDLNNGLSRSAFVAAFVYCTLNLDLNKNNQGFYTAYILATKSCQNRILRKANYGLAFSRISLNKYKLNQGILNNY